jgi:bacterial/archaeal transporter family protein
MPWISWALISALFAAGTAILAKFGVVSIDSNLAPQSEPLSFSFLRG